MIWKLAYKLYGQRIAKAIKDNEVRPDGFSGTSYAFTDHKGKLYYAWPKAEMMPAARIMRIEACMVQIDHGTSSNTAQRFSDAMIARCNDIAQASSLKVCKDKAVELATLCKELTFRRKNLIPEETYFDLAALCAIREDEDPYKVDPQIHVQKIATFREASAGGDPFFMASPAFRGLLGPSLTTVEGLHALLSNWTLRRIREEVMFASM